MKRITSFKTLLSMLAMIVMGSTVAVAENKVYISDFSIAAGDEVDIAINFDTDATDIRGIEGTITLPAGLTAGDNATKADDTRAAGLLNNYKGSNGLFKLRGMLSSNVITGTTGAVAYLKVKADASLAATSIIKLSSFTIEHSDGTKEDATTANATVTCTSATPSVNTLVADPEEIGLFAGGEAEFTVSLNNEEAITGLQATLELPTGVTATVTKSDRLTGAIWQYNATTGAIKYWGASALAGNEGAVFTVKLTADDTFTTPAKVTLSDVKLTNSKSQSITVDPIIINIVAPTVNTDGLLLEINKANKVVEDANAEEAPEALKALKDELEKAKEILANPVGKVQSEIDAETAALKAAREAYPKAVAKEALDKEIAAATDLLGESATDADPGKALNDAITAAKAVSAKADATVDELNAATKALKAAEEAYNKAVAKEALDKEIATANDLLGESATDADPGKALKEAIDAAQTVAAKADATADDLNAATEALKAAEEAFNTATGIESVKVDDLTKDGAVYNLNGVRVTNPTKGLYIKNGKKYMVK